MAQLMARAYHRTGDHRFADAARGALAAFRVPVARGGVVSAVAEPGGAPQMPWYVERAYPGANPWKGAALNGFMVTLLNLHATAPLLRVAARAAAAAGPASAPAHPAPARRRPATSRGPCRATGEQTLARYLPLHDTGHLEPLRPPHAGLSVARRTSPTTATTATT